MILRAAIFLLIFLPFPAIAGTCAALQTVAQEAHEGFEEEIVPGLFTGAESCAMSTDEAGNRSFFCQWSFFYRAEGAAAVHDMLDRMIPVCVKGTKPLPADTGVNHPDSYELRRYQRGPVVISVSLKDKAAQDQSLVFLRFDIVAP